MRLGKGRVLYPVIALMIIACGLSVTCSDGLTLVCTACNDGVVEKIPGESFEVEIKLKNAGSIKTTWSVNIAFEGRNWFWTGASKILTLEPCKSESLIWTGEIPEDAEIWTVARLVVYYNESFESLDWWIRVIGDVEPSIISSNVE
ncbi:hypothetical protein GTO27_00585 [Candidatus Bathyarchaeota archaeon]|nr:hypothetical protein [Candidatus Bathyarchaeota archaeon]